MNHQGAGRGRRAADKRRRPPQPSPDGASGASSPDDRLPEGTGPLPAQAPGYGAATGPHRLLASGTGAQPLASPGTGAQPLASPGTSPQRLPGSGTTPQRLPGSGADPQLPASGTDAQPIASPGTGPYQLPGSGTDPQRLHGSGTGSQPLPGRGSGGQPVLGPGTAPVRLTGAGSDATGPFERSPVRGFPPGRRPAGPSPAGPSPAEPLTAADGFRASTTGPSRAEPLTAADGFRASRTGPVAAAPPDTGPRAAPGRRRGSRPKRGLRSRTGWLAAAVVVAAAGGFAGYRYLYEPRVNAPVPPTLRLPTTVAGSSSFDKALGKWQHIGTRAEDPQPLTITQLYPPQFVLDGATYVRTAASVTETCSLAVYGTSLEAALQSGHCTQVVRASYISGDGTMMGTVGVVNLISSAAAQKAGQVTGPQEIIAPLTAKKGATSKLGNGTGVVQAEIKGHYLILMWAQSADLKSPSGPAQRQALDQFAVNLVTGSANIDLSTRMLSGKP